MYQRYSRTACVMNTSLIIPYLALGQSTVKQHTKIPHDPELTVLARDIPNIILKDKPPNTVKRYADAFQRWNSWAKSKGLKALPTTGYELALYLAFLIKTAKSMATIYSAVYGIAWANQKNVSGFPN